jgi:hypothetical protein
MLQLRERIQFGQVLAALASHLTRKLLDIRICGLCHYDLSAGLLQDLAPLCRLQELFGVEGHYLCVRHGALASRFHPGFFAGSNTGQRQSCTNKNDERFQAMHVTCPHISEMHTRFQDVLS